MSVSQIKNRIGLKFSRVTFFRIIFIFAVTVSVLIQYHIADAKLVKQIENTEDDTPVFSDDYDPVDFLPSGLPPSKNDPASDIKS